MIKNRMPLSKLLAIVLLTIMFFSACFAYAFSFDFGRRDTPDMMFFIFTSVSILFLFSAIGFWRRREWGRVLLKVILILLIIAWTGLVGYWYLSSWDNIISIQKLLIVAFTCFMYAILLAGIFFINNYKLRDEFEENQVNNDNAIN